METGNSRRLDYEEEWVDQNSPLLISPFNVWVSLIYIDYLSTYDFPRKKYCESTESKIISWPDLLWKRRRDEGRM